MKNHIRAMDPEERELLLNDLEKEGF